MSRMWAFATVGIVAFLVGGFSFWLANRAYQEKVEPRPGGIQKDGGEETVAVLRVFVIEGMSCQGCVDTITSALTRIPRVQSVDVSLQDKRAIVLAKESEVPTERIIAAITDAGYQGRLAPMAQSTSTTTIESGKQPIREMRKSVAMQPIGIIHSPYKEAKGTPIQGVFDIGTEAWVELSDEYAKGLKDLDGFSHAILLYHFHLADKVEIVGKPYLEDQEHGIFAMRSPNRPNHIGLSVVKIKKNRREPSLFHRSGCSGRDAGSGHKAFREAVRQPQRCREWLDRETLQGRQPASAQDRRMS